MKKFALMLFVLLFLVPFATSANRADAQVVVRLGHGHRRPYHRRYYHHRYYHHPYHRY